MLLDDIENAVVIDFETDPIRSRPDYPPKPCGVAIKVGAVPAQYYAWGHPTGNNIAPVESLQVLETALGYGRPLLFHNAKFDLAVLCEVMGFQLPSWQRVHDTLPMLFLLDPRAPTYSLKPSAEKLLGWPPSERDEVIEWLLAHQPVPGVKLSTAPKSEHYAGAWICKAPGDVVGRYACGDVDRTRALALWAAPRLEQQGMVEPYDRERRLLPVIMRMEREGVRVDQARLERDVELADRTMVEVDRWLRWRLKDEDVNLDSSSQLAQALVQCGAATLEALGVTRTGKRAANREARERAVNDAQLLAVLRYRAQLKNSVGMFMTPWLEVAQRSRGFIYTTWHSTRTSHHEVGVGARTGRLSSTPNFQNLSRSVESPFTGDVQPPLELPPLPQVRSYIVPYGGGDVLIDRDFSQQELRILAHYEEAELLRAYQADPWVDFHAFAQRLINDMLGTAFSRKAIKTTGFGLLYGLGVGLLAKKIGMPVDEAQKVKGAYLQTFPALRQLYDDMKQRARCGEPLRTWGGRLYYCEPAKVVNGRVQRYDYRMVNLLIQGSAADCTKEVMARLGPELPAHHRLLLTVHDELVVSVPRAERDAAMAQLREAMESVRFDVPMLSEGTWSPDNWAALREYDAKGVVTCAD